MATKKTITEKQRAALDKGRKKIDSENAREYQLNGAQKRKENRLAREILAEELAKNNRKQKGLDVLAEKYSTGDFTAVKLVQEILEESENKQTIDFNIKVDFGDE